MERWGDGEMGFKKAMPEDNSYGNGTDPQIPTCFDVSSRSRHLNMVKCSLYGNAQPADYIDQWQRKSRRQTSKGSRRDRSWRRCIMTPMLI